MKFSTKVLAVLGAAVVAGAFAGCDGLGKDDFYGTWTSEYTIPTATETDAQGGGYNSTYAGQTVNLEMFFSGKTTSSLVSTCVFYQHKVRDTNNHTFWVGTYNLEDNSNLTEGNLVLSYMYGYGWSGDSLSVSYTEDGETKTVTTVDGLVALAKAADWSAFEQFANDNQVLTYNSKNYCSDIETFSFTLGDSSLFSGYQSMTATEKKWEAYYGTNESSTTISKGASSSKPTKSTVKESQCSWEVKTRSFTLANADSKLTTESLTDYFADDSSSTASSNVVSFSRVLTDLETK